MRFRSVTGKTKGRFITEKRWLREREMIDRRVTKLGREMKKAIRARDAARSPKVKAKWQKVIDKDRPKQHKEMDVRSRAEAQGEVVPKQRRVEVSLRFRDTIPRRSRAASKNRLSMLKVVVQVTKRGVTKAQIERAVETAIRTGKSTKGIRIKFADWGAQRYQHGQVVRSKGRLEQHDATEKSVAEQLKPFAGLLRKDAVIRREVSGAGEKRAGRGGKGRAGGRSARRRGR